MHPISTIPLETLLHIFLQLHHSVHRTAIKAPKSPLGAIRLVCRLWDTAVTETPVFWTTLRFGWKTNPEDTEWSALLALHLERSKDLPLNLVIWGKHAKQYVFEVLVEHVTRWRSVTIHQGDWDEGQNDTDPADLLHNLEMINVVFVQLVSSYGRQPPRTIIKAPKLQRLVWNHGHVMFPEGHSPPLQTIILQKFDYDHRFDSGLGNVSLPDIFLCQGTLQELSFKPLEDPPSHATFEQPIFHQLHTLRLDATLGLQWLRFMEHCQFPSLHTFGIKLEISHQPSSTMPIWPSVRRLEWRSYIRHQIGSYQYLQKQSIPGLLQPFLISCPNITAISFAGDPTVGDDPELSVLAEGEDIYCPELEKIEAESCGLEILDYLTTQRPSLKTISMKQWHPKDKPDTHHNRYSLLLPDLIRSRVTLLVRSEEN